MFVSLGGSILAGGSWEYQAVVVLCLIVILPPAVPPVKADHASSLGKFPGSGTVVTARLGSASFPKQDKPPRLSSSVELCDSADSPD